MNSLKKNKKEIFINIFFCTLIIAGIIGTITAVDNIILKYVQYFFHKTLRKPERWIDILQNTSRLFVFTVCIIYFLLFTNAGNNIRHSIKIKLSEHINNIERNKIILTIIFLIIFFLIAYFNVIAANYFYEDDVFRNYTGNRSWIGFSRYISEFLSIFLHNNISLNDIAPLTHFIAIIVSAITVIILSLALTNSIAIKKVLPLSIIFIMPFFSQNFSYRFDALYMALSILFSAIPFLFMTDSSTFIFTSIFGLLLTCFSYQASVSVYIVLTIYFALKKLINNNIKEIFTLTIKAILSFIVALLIFKFLFMNKMNNTADDYFSTRIKISALLKNAVTYIKETSSYTGGIFTKLIIIFSATVAYFQLILFSKCRKILTALMLPIVAVLTYVLSFGPYLIFERPTFTPRAFIGFNVMIALIFLTLEETSISKKSKKLSRILTGCMIYSLIVFLFTYGNCLKNQKEYTTFRISTLLNDISENTNDLTDKINICVKGSMETTQKNRIAEKNYPLIKKLIGPSLTESSSWNDEILNSYNFKCICKDIEITEEFLLVKNTYYHTIYRLNNDFIVVLK